MKKWKSKFVSKISSYSQKHRVKQSGKMMFISFVFLACYLFTGNNKLTAGKEDVVLGTIISSLGIIIAIVTTFIFSKVFSERSERVDRKKLIDAYSKKLTALRRLAHRILLHDEIIWLNMKPQGIEELYPGLTVWGFRGAEYTKYLEIIENTKGSELSIQAYLAAKLLEGENPDQYMIDPTFHKNYSLEEIADYRDASIFVYSFLSEYQSKIRLDRLHEHWLTGIQEEVQIISGKNEKLDVRLLFLTFNDAYSDQLVRLYGLTQLNRKSVGTSFEGLLFDLALSSLIIIISVYALSFSICDHVKETLIRLSLCGLVTVIIDILVNTFISTKKELSVDEFYE
jgi:hypothetical protein